MSARLLDLLSPPGTPDPRVQGVVVAIVTNNEDPDGLARVRLRFPWLSEDDESHWARVVTPMAGPDRGLLLIPEVDDEVLVAFEHGDPRFPYVLGALWSDRDLPPEPQPLDGGKVAKRLLRSRSGHLVQLDDTEGAEKIEIVDASGSNSVVIDTAARTVTVRADGDLVLESTNGAVVIRGGAVQVEAGGQGVKVDSDGSLDLSATGQTSVKGSTVNIN